MTPKDVIKMAQENKAVMANFKFLDFPGIWQHFAVPIAELKEEIFEEGLGFDGSSIRGWQAITHIGHADHPGSEDRIHGPVYGVSDDQPYLQYRGPDHKGILHKGPEIYCPEG